MLRWTTIAAIALTGALSSCDKPEDDPMARSDKPRVTNPAVSAKDHATQVQGNNAFALELYHAIRADGENLFASPHSISTALAMTYGGARAETEREMAAALHFDLPQSSLHSVFNKLDLELQSRGQGAKGSDGAAFELSVANSLWGRPDGTYLPTFLDLMAQHYDTGVHLVDFGGDPDGVRRRINDWVARRTRDRIKELLHAGDIDTNTALVLINAIYFNAAWDEPFEEQATAPRSFDADGSSVTVQMMSGLKQHARYASAKGYQVLELPFDGKELSMLVLLPDPGRFRTFQQGLTPQAVDDAVGLLAAQEVMLDLPRFSFSSRRKLRAALERLGMKQAFDPLAANFAGIGGTAGGPAGLVIKDVIHQAFVQVAEKGAEAAGATAVLMADAGISGPPESVQVTVDRPFLFFIRDNATGVILFMGHVVDPNR